MCGWRPAGSCNKLMHGGPARSSGRSDWSVLLHFKEEAGICAGDSNVQRSCSDANWRCTSVLVYEFIGESNISHAHSDHYHTNYDRVYEYECTRTASLGLVGKSNVSHAHSDHIRPFRVGGALQYFWCTHSC